MMAQSDLEQMTLKQLRGYVLEHRSDIVALRYYMDKLRDDPNVFHASGGMDEQGMAHLQQLIQDRANKKRP